MVTVGAGSAVTTIDRSATFDSLNADGISLVGYTEGQLIISANNTLYQGTNFFVEPIVGDGSTQYFYGNGGDNSFVTITGTDGAIFSAIEFMVGDGFGGVASPNTRVAWATYLNGILTGSGTDLIPQGGVIGFLDATGFDELRVAADDDNINGPTFNFGDAQAIAIDNLNAQLSSSATGVPEPASLAVWGICSAGFVLAGLRRRRDNTNQAT